MPTGPATPKYERILVLILCLLGAVHVLVFSAAFPFFSVVDEQMHFDLAVRYAHADIPRTLTTPSAEALPFLAVYGTPEYLWQSPEHSGVHIPPPPWKQPLDTVREKLLAKEAAYQDAFQNHEASSPPLYYAVAGVWWQLGRLIKLDGGYLLYWMRFLNVPCLAAVVWLGWLAGRRIFPESIFIRLTVPALIAFFPQSTFYAINNDILTPLTFGIVFVLLLKLADAEEFSPRLAAGLGVAFAAAYLTKVSNLPLLAAAGLFVAWKVLRLIAAAGLRRALPGGLIFALLSGLPIAAWMLWCQVHFGDPTGSSAKQDFLGWTVKPMADWLAHPLFSRDGLWYFVKGNLASFWQGEMLWHRQPMSLPGVGSAYVVLTLGAQALALAALISRPPVFTTYQRAALWRAFICLGAALVFFAVLSLRYDFQDCFYPSREHPFFVSGRLMLGVLIPFAILFACGFDCLMRHFGNATKFLLLLGLLGFMLASEIAADLPAFNSEYNWFHL